MLDTRSQVSRASASYQEPASHAPMSVRESRNVHTTEPKAYARSSSSLVAARSSSSKPARLSHQISRCPCKAMSGEVLASRGLALAADRKAGRGNRSRAGGRSGPRASRARLLGRLQSTRSVRVLGRTSGIWTDELVATAFEAGAVDLVVSCIPVESGSSGGAALSSSGCSERTIFVLTRSGRWPSRSVNGP